MKLVLIDDFALAHYGEERAMKLHPDFWKLEKTEKGNMNKTFSTPFSLVLDLGLDQKNQLK